MELDLQAIPTVVLHNPANTRRAEHMNALLSGLGMNYALFPALNGEGYILSAAKSLMAIFEQMLLREPFTPFLLLEDDANITPWTEFGAHMMLHVPADADAVYVGISKCGADPNKETHQMGVSWEPTDLPGVVRILNMLSQHAVVICSKRWLVMLLRTISAATARNIIWDLPTARVMDRYRVYALEKPLFFQDARIGGQQDPTLVTLADINKMDHQPSSAQTLVVFEPPVHLREWPGIPLVKHSDT